MIAGVTNHLVKNIKDRIEMDGSIANKEAMLYHMDKAFRYLHDPFQNIHTGYKQKRFMRKHWSYVDATPMVLGTHVETKVVRNVTMQKEVDDVYYHIPIIDSLSQFLQNEQILNLVLAEKSHAPPGFLIDFWDGHAFKQHPVLANMDECPEDEAILALQIYYDDLEVCNPLGGGSHNIAMFYYRLANIEPMYRSMLPAMRLIGCTETKYLKQYGIDTVLRRIIDDLTQLKNVSI